MKAPLTLPEMIQTARGETPADLLIQNGQVVNVFTGEIVSADIAICKDRIVAVGTGYEARQTIDAAGRIVCPGFIDGHVHIESTMLAPDQFARAVVPHGTTAVVCDPHEIANVMGLDGIRYILDASDDLPLTVFVMMPSCVPATHLETAGATLTADDLPSLLEHPRVLGLAEMMNFPGVLFQQPDVLAKLEAARGRDLPIDGHAPGLGGRDLQAYVAAGPKSDHECTRLEEALEKLRAGMYLFIREGTTEHNLTELLDVMTPVNSRRCVLVSDDRHPDDLIHQGHMDHSLRLAIENGLNPITAIQMVTLNPAERFRLWDRGAIAPGYRADLVIADELNRLEVQQVIGGGELVAEAGRMTAPPNRPFAVPPSSIHVGWDGLSLKIPAVGSRIRVIGILEGQIVTESLELEATLVDDVAVSNVTTDVLKLAVIERHRGSGGVGLGFVRGIGLKRGALASTVAHDSHNLIVVGANDADMLTAARAVADAGGGLAAAADRRVLECIPLPIAGLMTEDTADQVDAAMRKLLDAAHRLGAILPNPFMTLSFLALPVIPTLKLTDRGLIDVGQFDFVSLFVD